MCHLAPPDDDTPQNEKTLEIMMDGLRFVYETRQVSFELFMSFVFLVLFLINDCSTGRHLKVANGSWLNFSTLNVTAKCTFSSRFT